MTQDHAETIGLIAELLTILGLVGAVSCGLIGVIMRLTRGKWHRVPAEAVGDELRWIDDSGTLHVAPHDGDLPPGDAGVLHVHYRQGRPELPYWEAVAHDEKTLLVTAGILAGVAVLAIATSIVLLFV